MNSADEPLTLQISFRVAKTVRDELERRALDQRLSLSDYVRKLVVDALATSDSNGNVDLGQVAAMRKDLGDHHDGIRALLSQHLKLMDTKGQLSDLKAASEIHRLREDFATVVVAMLYLQGNFPLEDAIAWAKEHLAPAN